VLFLFWALKWFTRYIKVVSLENIKNNQVKIAVIGLGKMGLLHASLLNILPNVKLAALCDISGMIRKIYRRLFRDAFITDDVEKLADLDLNSVYVTTPIPTHFPIVKTIYSKSIAHNLFVEKTLASNYDESREICLLAQRSNGVNMVGYMKRFAVTFKKGKEFLNEGIIGELVSFKAYAYSSDFADVKGRSIPGSRGGVLSDLGSHALDLALWYFGDLRVESAEMKSLCGSNVDDAVCVRVSGINGFEGYFDISWCKKDFRMPEIGFIFHGTKGNLKVTDDEVRLELNNGESHKWYRHDLNDNVNFLLGGPEYFREDEHFIRAILNGRQAEPDFSEAAKVDLLIDQIKKVVQKNG
jgi:predicted dehydrogenase